VSLSYKRILVVVVGAAMRAGNEVGGQ
jgi:hypothetical protein